MKPTKAQLTKIHLLFAQMQLLDQKKDFVKQYSNGRATSSKDLTFKEAAALIGDLVRFDPCDRMRRKVYALAYEAGIIYGDTDNDKRMNTAKLSAFILKSGTVKKELNKMDKNELSKLVTQFEMIIRHQGQTQANKATKNVLTELGISVASKQPAKSI